LPLAIINKLQIISLCHAQFIKNEAGIII